MVAQTNYYWLRTAIAVAILATALLVMANFASAQTTTPPSGLGGETLQSNTPTITSCNVSDSGATFTYQVSGVATGAYPGTFVETGTVTVGPQDTTLRQRVTAFTAQFTINSTNGQVSGTKSYVPTGDPNTNVANGRCSEGFFGGENSGSLFIFRDDLRYEATISTPDGQSCTQQGDSLLRLIKGSSVLPDEFSETFYNDISNPTPSCEGGEEPPPTVPTTKEQCKDGGFANFPALGFKNQGQCVAFVERGPKNAL